MEKILCVYCKEFFNTDTPKHFFDDGVVLKVCPNCVVTDIEKLNENGNEQNE